MCHYQDIHFAYHHELLNLSLIEQEIHTCAHRIIVRGEDEGQKCLLHSCCLFRRDIVFQCPHLGEAGDDLCEKAYIEVVFVPLEIEPEEVVPDSDGIERPVMEFWLEDKPGRVFRVYFEDEALGDDGAEKSMSLKLRIKAFWDSTYAILTQKS